MTAEKGEKNIVQVNIINLEKSILQMTQNNKKQQKKELNLKFTLSFFGFLIFSVGMTFGTGGSKGGGNGGCGGWTGIGGIGGSEGTKGTVTAGTPQNAVTGIIGAVEK